MVTVRRPVEYELGIGGMNSNVVDNLFKPDRKACVESNASSYHDSIPGAFFQGVDQDIRGVLGSCVENLEIVAIGLDVSFRLVKFLVKIFAVELHWEVRNARVIIGQTEREYGRAHGDSDTKSFIEHQSPSKTSSQSRLHLLFFLVS